MICTLSGHQNAYKGWSIWSNEFIVALENDPRYAEIAIKRKEKAELKERYTRGCNGNCVVSFTPSSVRNLNTKEIKSELRSHCIAPGQRNKFELLQCLVNHYQDASLPKGSLFW